MSEIEAPLRRRRAPPPIIAASVPEPPPRRRRPPTPPEHTEITDATDAGVYEHPAARAGGRFMLEGFHRPIGIYQQHHGAPDYVKRHMEELRAYQRACETGNEQRIEAITDKMICNLYMYEDALRRFFQRPFLTDEQFAKLEYEMLGSIDNTPGGCHKEIISVDGKDVLMRWHTASGEIVRDDVNCVIFFKLLEGTEE